ncbi:MAG: hypothetical protein LBD96_09410 [Treponema sp.]|nr:hypothetical protein [Treponema sp.]
MQNKRLKLFGFPVLMVWLLVLFSGCDYGLLGNADQTGLFLPREPQFEAIMSSMSGVWYSHYAGTGRLDGYRIGTMENFNSIMPSGKTALFPSFKSNPPTYTNENVDYVNDYFVFYDDTVYGEKDDNTGGNGGWEGLVTRYIGIVRAINIFNDDPDRGAIIIEYLTDCAPGWLEQWPESSGGKVPFFGIYYRKLDKDTIQMANAIDLAAYYNGEKYYTETASLNEAIAKNDVRNEAEFISWGVVIPQDREK